MVYKINALPERRVSGEETEFATTGRPNGKVKPKMSANLSPARRPLRKRELAFRLDGFLNILVKSLEFSRNLFLADPFVVFRVGGDLKLKR